MISNRRNAEANARRVIWNDQKYFYTKCNFICDEVVNDEQENVDRPQPVKRKRLRRLIRGDSKWNEKIKEYGKGDEPGPVTKNQAPHENDSDDDNSTDVEILERDEIIERGISGLFFPSTTVKKEEQDGEGNTPHEDDDTSTEVEILDGDEIMDIGVASAFVPGTMHRDKSDVSQASAAYREKVLNILQKPYNKEEYQSLSEEIKFYVSSHPDLKKKLTENRYKKPARMNIFRGFFYWLQNLVHEGSFKPWMDSQCFAVQPGPEQKT